MNSVAELAPPYLALTTCACCKRLFAGPSNKLYCSKPCKRRVKYEREKIGAMLARQEFNLITELEAAQSGDFAEVRKIRNSRIQDFLSIAERMDEPPFKGDKVLEERIDRFFQKMRTAELNGYTLRVAIEAFRWREAIGQKTLIERPNRGKKIP